MIKYLSVFFLLSTSILFAQSTTKLKVTESATFKDKVKSYGISSMHTTKDGFTGIIRESKRDILFDVFDDKLNKIYSTVVESHKKESYVGDLFYGDEIKFFTVFSPKARERIVYCHVFNLKNKTHKKIKLFEKIIAKRTYLFPSRSERQTSFAISPNGKYFALVTDNIKKDINSYAVRVFDSNTLKLINETTYQEHEEKYFVHNDLSVDNDATVFVLGKLYKKGKADKKKGEANYEFILNKVSKNGVKDLAISLGEDFIKSLTISIKNNQLHLLGFYSGKNSSRIKGGCNFIVNPESFSLVNKKNYELPKDVYEDLYGYRKAVKKKKKKKELKNFYIDYILEDSFGSTYLLAEEFYITSHYVSSGNGGGYWSTTYHYDDILILKFNESGDLAWGRSIYKKATSPSYNAFIKNDNLHVILNSGKNLTEKKDGRTKVSKGWFESSSLYDIVYNNEGEVSYDKIQDNKGKTYYTPFYGNYSNEKFIMKSSGRKKRQFMILE